MKRESDSGFLQRNDSWLIRVFSGYFNGLGKHRKALSFIFRNGLWWYFLFPILLNITIMVSGFQLVTELADESIAAIGTYLPDTIFGLETDSWISTILFGFIWIVLRILSFLLFAFLGGYLVLIFLSPILAILSQKVEQIELNKHIPFSSLQFLNDIMRSVALAIRNFLIEVILIFALFFLSFIPFLGLFTPFILFGISAYFFGFSSMDYTLERRKIGMSQSTRFMKKHSGSAMGIGTPLALVLLIPFVGAFFAGFVVVTSVVAGTLESIELLEKD